MKKGFETLFTYLIIIAILMFFAMIILGKMGSPHIHKLAMIGFVFAGVSNFLLSVGGVFLKENDKNEKK